MNAQRAMWELLMRAKALPAATRAQKENNKELIHTIRSTIYTSGKRDVLDYKSCNRRQYREYMTLWTTDRVHYHAWPLDNQVPADAQRTSKYVTVRGIYEAIEDGPVNTLWYCKEWYWADEILQLKKEHKSIADAHDKRRYFRLDGKYYDREVFFEHEGKAYNKEEYAIFEGNIYLKSKTVQMEFYMHVWDISAPRDFTYKVVLPNTDTDTIYSAASPYKRTESGEIPILRVTYHVADVDGNNSDFSMPTTFLATMFKSGNKRFWTENTSFCLTKSEIMNLEFAPMSSHKELINTAQNRFDAFVREHKDRCASDIKHILERYNFKNWLESKVQIHAELISNARTKGNGVLANIYKQLFTCANDNYNNYTLDEFMSRVEILKQLLKKEAEYEKIAE